MGVPAGGVVGIGASYGVTLTKDEGWKLVKEFFKAAAFTYAATIVGGKLISFAVAVTGIGYAGAGSAEDSAIGRPYGRAGASSLSDGLIDLGELVLSSRGDVR